MASIFTHAVVGFAVGKLIQNASSPRVWWLSVVCAIVPDADVASFSFGIPYGHILGHRGLMHSLIFAVVLSVIVIQIWFPTVERWSRSWWGLFGCFFLATASHGVLDALTDGGLGVAFFSPFENSRYFLPWRPVLVSPIGVTPFFSRYGLEVLMSEFIWIWIPTIFILLFTKMFWGSIVSHN